jgi:peptide/nickel transport system permease protein
VAESDLLVGQGIAPRPEVTVRPNRRAGHAVGPATLAMGVVVAWLVLAPFGDLDGKVKVPVTLVGIGLAYVGVDLIAKDAFGERFETTFWLSIAWLGGLVLAASFAALLPLGEHIDTTKTIADPGNLRPDLFSAHPLGTNNFSLDLLSQSIYGARVSLLAPIVAVVASAVIGGSLGLLAGYYRGATDTAIVVVGDSLLAFPPLLLLVALAAVVGVPHSVPEAIAKSGVALAIVSVPTMMRLARVNTLVPAQREYVLASRSLGARSRRIIVRELVPNVALPIVSYASIILAVLIIADGSLSFLGLGLQQPNPTWGNMIAEADLTTLRDTPHIALVPGAFMFLTVLAFNCIGQRAQRRWSGAAPSS